MPETKGHCPHGEFDILKGCPQCIEERRQEALVNSPENIGKRIEEAEANTTTVIGDPPEPVGTDPNAWKTGDEEQRQESLNIVKVQFLSLSTGKVSSSEYTYYSVEPLAVSDIVDVPIRDTTTKAQVSAIDVPEEEIAAFKDKVKTIPAGSLLPAITPEQEEMEAGLNGEGLTLTNTEPATDATQIAEAGKAIDIIEAQERKAVLALRPGEDMEVRGYFEEAEKLLEYAEKRVITTAEDLKPVNDDLALISKITKAMNDKRKSLLEPLKLQSNAIRETYDYLMLPILQAGKLNKEKMLSYDAEVERKRQVQEDINRKRQEIAEQEMKLKGELSEPVGLVEVAPEPLKSISTELGTAGRTDHWKYEVTDFALLPDEYKVVDTAMLNNTAKKHHDAKQIPGVRFYNEPFIAVRAR